MQILAAEFRRYLREPDTWYVEVEATIGTVTQPYTLVLTVGQAIEADIVERVDATGDHGRRLDTFHAFNRAGRRVKVTIPE